MKKTKAHLIPLKHKMFTHTPGPWIHNKGQVYEQATGGNICIMQNMGYMDAIDEADAALIATAPDLLQSLKTVTAYLQEAHQDEIDKNHYGDKTPCSYCQAIADAKEAIFNAEGHH